MVAQEVIYTFIKSKTFFYTEKRDYQLRIILFLFAQILKLNLQTKNLAPKGNR
jgi:hypothetical protein